MMIQEVGVDVVAKRVLWIKACPDFDMLFQLLKNLRVDEQRRFWIEYHKAEENVCDNGEGKGQEGSGSQNFRPNVPQCLDKSRGVRTMKGKRLKVRSPS